MASRNLQVGVATEDTLGFEFLNMRSVASSSRRRQSPSAASGIASPPDHSPVWRICPYNVSANRLRDNDFLAAPRLPIHQVRVPPTGNSPWNSHSRGA
jgi:hypothetical protein